MPCGDMLATLRTSTGTTIICADGIGSGIRARVAAQMCVSRLIESLQQQISLRTVFQSVVASMQNCRDTQKNFAAFSIARVRSDSYATVLSYDAPLPIMVSRQGATLLAHRPFPLSDGLAMESNCQLDKGEGFLLMSDGITQAGLGYGANTEWTSEGVVHFINNKIFNNKTGPQLDLSLIPDLIHQEALLRWRGGIGGRTVSDAVRHSFGDDCSVILGLCRKGQTVNILTGPPLNREDDTATFNRFLELPGMKVVCGGTTSKLVARRLNVPLEMESEPSNPITPPRYAIKGMDLVTEGAVTLNQVYNILEEDIASLQETSVVTELRLLLLRADRINIIVGLSDNSANTGILFRQRGVLSRRVLIPLLAEKLRQEGKLVNVDFV